MNPHVDTPVDPTRIPYMDLHDGCMMRMYDMDIRCGLMIWKFEWIRDMATILDRGHSKWLSGWIQCPDPRHGPLQMALRMDPVPRSSTGTTQSGSPDGSNATILDRGHSKWLSGWIQRHDPRQGPLKTAGRAAGAQRVGSGSAAGRQPIPHAPTPPRGGICMRLSKTTIRSL